MGQMSSLGFPGCSLGLLGGLLGLLGGSLGMVGGLLDAPWGSEGGISRFRVKSKLLELNGNAQI